MTTSDPRRVVLGVGGGIAAYKVAEVLRRLTESGLSVRVVPTTAALEFVGEATWAALSGQPVATEVFANVHEVPHVRLGREADLVVVAPATADLLAKAAHGRADDLLTATLLTARCPVLFVPAMHTEMWEHPATVENVETLRRHGAAVLEPASGRLTGADTGKGRLPEPIEIATTAQWLLHRGRTDRGLAGRRVVVSAGGTREPLDPVRFLTNRSSGRQGYALARTAALRGAEVTLVAANTSLVDPPGVEIIRVTTTEQLRAAMVKASADADVVAMAAAPSDFRPAGAAAFKIKKSADGVVPPLELTQNPDILAELTARRGTPRGGGNQVIIGFAAETGDDTHSALDYGRVKLARKGVDLLAVNEVGDGRAFDVTDNAATVLAADGTSVEVENGPKEHLADVLWNLALDRLKG